MKTKEVSPCVSVIVPIYNQQDYLRQCIESILNQSHQNLEVYLIDDGSTDSSGSICEEYQAKDSRVKVVHKSNGGLSDARNAGLERCRGQYILFVDSDDFIRVDMIEKLLASIETEHADIAVCDCYLTDKDGELLKKQNRGISDTVYTGEEILRFKVDILLEDLWLLVVAWNKLYRRSLFNRVRFPKGKIHEDEYIFCKIYRQATTVSCISDKLYYYRKHDGTITDGEGALSVLDRIEAICLRSRFYFENGWLEMPPKCEKSIYIDLWYLVMQNKLSSAPANRRREVLKQCRALVREMYRRKLIPGTKRIYCLAVYSFPVVIIKMKYYFNRIRRSEKGTI